MTSMNRQTVRFTEHLSQTSAMNEAIKPKSEVLQKE